MVYAESTTSISAIAAPVIMIISFCESVLISVPNCANIAVSRVSIETRAAANLTDFAQVSTGLLYFLYLTRSTIAELIIQKE